jgi:trehalose 6-phosphate synthase/phosphatase
MSAQELVLVSNRIPITFSTEKGKLKGVPSSGGLVTALEPVLKKHGGIWVGAAGTQDSREVREILKREGKANSFRYEPLFLSEEEQTNFYEGFSNEIIWPLFHDLQSRCNFEPRFWDFYQTVNEKFADAVEKASRPDDLIWIQDYQLMQVGRVLRKRRPDARLAFFLHIPFPSPDIFAKLPWRQQILEDLLAHDLVGLQTGRDQRNLIACLRCFLPSFRSSGRGELRVVQRGEAQCHIAAFPISIDFHAFSDQSKAPSIVVRANEIKASVDNIPIVVGVDRLDYTKGIPERIKAFGYFLRKHEQFRGKVQLIQVVVPSRQNIPRYDQLKQEVERLVAQVNGEFSEPGWVPINFIYRPVQRDELIAMYRAADVGLITCLKDGMNLVAKEYCAAKSEADGVLILSEFAGAAPELRIGALIVNPYDEAGVAEALQRALEMPAEERRRRMLRLRGQIRRADILAWRNRFFAAWGSTARGAPGLADSPQQGR